jgi:hypothetical protein
MSDWTRIRKASGRSAAPHRRARNHADSVNVASVVLRNCPIVAKTAILSRGVASLANIAIRFRKLLALDRNQKLLPHFGEAGTAVFAVKEIEYGWHHRPPVV